jgi:hypothetical protein
MTDAIKRPQPKPDMKAEVPQKTGAALDEKQLDGVTGGACVKGEHIKEGIITVRGGS